MTTVGNTTTLLGRPLTARSVIASLLLGMHPPRLSAQRLVQWCELFGIAPGTARVALSRMTERGELVADRAMYELAGRVRSRQAAQDWSIEPQLPDWDGSWSLAFVVGDARDANDRAALRTAMARCRYRELREGCWARPDNLPRAAAPDDAWAVVDRQCAWWHGEPDERAGPLAARLFAPEEWSARARELGDRLAVETATLRGGSTAGLADAFVLGAATLQHVRNDPLLPRELLSRRWPGKDLRRTYTIYQRAFATATATWFRRAEGNGRK
jgi:phenylacetic acid degradation operon negative regulatory protein